MALPLDAYKNVFLRSIFQLISTIIIELLVRIYVINNKFIELINWLMEFKKTSIHFNTQSIINKWFMKYKEIENCNDHDTIFSLRYLVKNCHFQIKADHIFIIKEYFDVTDIGLFLLNELQDEKEINIFISNIDNAPIQLWGKKRSPIIEEQIIRDYIYQYPKLFLTSASKVTSRVLCLLNHDKYKLFDDYEGIYVSLDKYLERFQVFKQKCINNIIMNIIPVYELAKLIAS